MKNLIVGLIAPAYLLVFTLLQLFGVITPSVAEIKIHSFISLALYVIVWFIVLIYNYIKGKKSTGKKLKEKK